METSPQTYFGKVIVGVIINFDIAEIPTKAPFTDRNYKVVFYPDCQQLILWMPEPGHLFDTMTIIDEKDNTLVFDRNIADILSGSVQIVLDTLHFAPGTYQLRVIRSGQLCFGMFFQKYAEGEEPQITKKHVPEVESRDKEPIVYRDGMGNILPDEDLLLREKVLKKIRDKFISKIQYFSTGRDGYIIFSEDGKTARFEMEMGGGDCMFFILIPDSVHWENNTGFLLADRDRIIEHIARMTQRDQAGGAEYKINEREIFYYRKR
ncbi:MAG: hypothetical protein IPN79_11120 [Saprospiraceae bacterium]|nr:hypothetical protein [Saprospiraceae bacterium]